jgi:phosphate transport system substrate-binding protein
MLILNRQLAAAYMAEAPGVSVRVEGGGTGEGVTALVAGAADLCAASRPLRGEEVQAIYQEFGTLGVRFLVAQDALSVFVNRTNPVRGLKVEELAGLFDGRIRSWAEVGGENLAVVAVVRPPSSGSHRFFRDHVLKGASYRADASTVARTSGVLDTVAADPAAVGYGGVAYTRDGVVAIALDGVAPTAEGVRSGAYPLARYLVFYAVAPPTGAAKSFIDFCLSPAGQLIVADVGYVPLF